MYKPSVINRIAIGDILRRSASRYPTKTAFVENDERLTFKEADDMANQFAHYLLNKGFKKGDTIVTVCGNSIEFAMIIFGIAKAGLVWVPINPGISITDKKYILNEVNAKLVIGNDVLIEADQDTYESFCETITLNGRLNTFHAMFDHESTIEPGVDIQDHDISQIMFTSGTTGNPKGVLINHVSVYFASLGNIIEIGAKSTDVGAAVLPMFHCAQHTLIMSYTNIGAKCVIFNSFDPELFLSKVEEEKISDMAALPMMYRALLHHPKRKSYDLTSLSKCAYAMAPMDRTTLETLIKEFDADFLLATGQTEMYPATMFFKPEEQLRRFGSYWGVTSIINDTAVMDDEGNILGVGEVGEIVHRGPNVMAGYLNNEEETNESRQFGWHHTGDLGYWDEDRQLVFVDRKKDMIKTGGENVASIKVEQALLNYDKVANAVAIGVPHAHWIEAVTAVVVPKPDVDITEEEIINHCKEHLGEFEVPKAVIFTDEFPMTTTGKIQKNILREKFESHYQVES